MSVKCERINILDPKKHQVAYNAGIRAFVDLTINDLERRRGYRVLDHGNGIWCAPPANRYTWKDKKGVEHTENDAWVEYINPDHENGIKEKCIEFYNLAKKGNSPISKAEPVELPY